MKQDTMNATLFVEHIFLNSKGLRAELTFASCTKDIAILHLVCRPKVLDKAKCKLTRPLLDHIRVFVLRLRVRCQSLGFGQS